MSMKLIPYDIIKDMNIDGYVDYRSRFSMYEPNELFIIKENEQFIKEIVYKCLVDVNWVNNKIKQHGLLYDPNVLVNMYKNNMKQILDEIDPMSHKLPYKEHVNGTTTMEILHFYNKVYINSILDSLVMSPDSVSYEALDNDPMGLTRNNILTEYGPSSYMTGFWKPQNLFTDTDWNRNVSYWDDTQLDIDPCNEEHVVGKRYNSSVYNTNNQFLHKFYTRRHQARSNDGFREAGMSGRRTAEGRKYNMDGMLSRKRSKQKAYVDDFVNGNLRI